MPEFEFKLGITQKVVEYFTFTIEANDYDEALKEATQKALNNSEIDWDNVTRLSGNSEPEDLTPYDLTSKEPTMELYNRDEDDNPIFTNKEACMVFNHTDNIYATNTNFATVKEAEDFIEHFRNQFKEKGYFTSKRSRIPASEIDLKIYPIGYPFDKIMKFD